MTGTYLSFFLTTFVGLTNVQLGTMNTVKGLIGLWGSFVIGVIMQKVRLPWGRYRSWIYIMMPLAGIFQILTFVNWGNLPEGIKFPLVFVICVLDTFLYNFAFAAYTGLMIPLAPDPTGAYRPCRRTQPDQFHRKSILRLCCRCSHCLYRQALQ